MNNIREYFYEVYKRDWINTHISNERYIGTMNEYYKEKKDNINYPDFPSFKDYIEENGFDFGEIYCSYDEFLDFEYLNTFFYNYAKDKVLSLDGEFDIHNIRNDFFVLLETEELAIAVGGNEMDFFFNDLKLDDDSLKELSNQWILYFLKYRLKRNIIMKDPMCEHNTLI